MVESKPKLVGNRFWALLWAPVLYIHIFRGKIWVISAQYCFQRVRDSHPQTQLWGQSWSCPTQFLTLGFYSILFTLALSVLYQTLPHLPCSLHIGHEILTVDENYRHCNVKSFTNLSLPSGLDGVCIFVQSFALDSFVLFLCVSHTPFPKFAFSGGWQIFSPFFLWTISLL